MRRALVCTALALAIPSGCAREAETPKLLVRVRAEPSAAGLTVFDRARELGRLDDSGQLSIATEAGAVHRLGVRCPPGLSAEPLEVAIPGDAGVGPIHAELVCEVVHRTLVVLVSTKAPGLPITVDGVEEARTDEAGYAWVRSERSPGVDVHVAVNTIGTPFLPETPSRTFRQPERDELAVFAVELSNRQVAKLQRPAPQGPRAPYRLR